MAEPINRLNSIDKVSAGDQLAVFVNNSGMSQKAAISVLQTYMQGNLDFSGSSYKTQREAPSATGFNITIENASDNTHLILLPTGAFAAGTITLPVSTGLADKQQVLVNCTQDITALTVAGNGATVTGAPATITANDFFTLKFDAGTSTWYRVG